MKIYELTPYKFNPIFTTAKDTFSAEPPIFDRTAHRYENLKKFTEFLADYGFKLVGKGSFGAVYEKPGYPWLFKLFTDDTPYEKYIRWVIAHQNNPHVPKIKGGLIKINDKTFVVRMEKLKPFNFMSSNLNLSTLSNILFNNDFNELSSNQKAWIKSRFPQLPEVINAIEKIIASDYGIDVDIHSDNIMLRGDVPVITDPLYDVTTI